MSGLLYRRRDMTQQHIQRLIAKILRQLRGSDGRCDVVHAALAESDPDTGAAGVDGAILQRLALVSFITDETNEMVAAEESVQWKWLIPHLQRIYGTVNGLMDTIDERSIENFPNCDD
jgi:hypothetical protein